jgi:hypothetical protein
MQYHDTVRAQSQKCAKLAFRRLSFYRECTAKPHQSKPTQTEIINELGVEADFNARQEIDMRIAFLEQYLTENSGRVYVIGISGVSIPQRSDDWPNWQWSASALAAPRRSSSRYAYRMGHRETKLMPNKRSLLSILTSISPSVKIVVASIDLEF